MTCTIIESLDAAEIIVDEWRELADACDSGPFARPLFALTWWRHLGQGSLMIATVREQGRLVALAPLHRRRVGPVQVVRWLGHGLGSVAQALVLPEHEEAGDALWRAASERGRVLDLIESHEHGHLPSSRSIPAGRRLSIQARDTCPVIDVRGDAETQLADRARKRVRRSVRVSRRRLEEAGLAFHVEAAHDAASLAAVLPDVGRVFDAAEAAQPRQHLLAGEWEGFTSAILREGTASGEVLVLVAYVGEAPAAFDIIFVSSTTLSSWIGRFDPAAAPYSPGHLVQCAGLDWAAAHGRAHIDLLLGDSYYKQLWSDRSYRTLEIESGPVLARSLLRGVAGLRARLRS